MNLPRHANAYLLFVGLLSLFQVTIGANLIVLAAIDMVALCALYPMTRKAFGPNDLLFLSFSLYYGTFSLALKCMVLQPVQQNLQVPMLTSSYLVGGFGLVFLSYLFVERVMTKHYRGTTLRRWNWFERAYADERFLVRFTKPILIASIVFVIIISMFSHSVQEVANGLASSGGLATLGSLTPIIQLALAMQLALMHRRDARIDRVMVMATMAIAIGISILNNQKAMTFMVAATYVIDALAFRVRFKPAFVLTGLAGVAFAFLYVSPLVHIVRGLDVEKSQRLTTTLSILDEAHYNPIELQEIQAKLPGADDNSISANIDYLAPNNFNTDRFTLLMPIDQMARASMRAPLGLDAFLIEMGKETLPKYVVGEHALESLPDQIAWIFSIRSNGVISRPTLGLFGTGYGVAGGWGLLLLAPLATLYVFAIIKLTCNGSIWQNPWAVFIASSQFFDGETDLTIFGSMLRYLLPLVVIAAILIATDRLFNKDTRQADLA